MTPMALLNIIGAIGGALMSADYLMSRTGLASPGGGPEGGGLDSVDEMEMEQILGGGRRSISDFGDHPDDGLSSFDTGILEAQNRGTRTGRSIASIPFRPGATTTNRSIDALLAGRQGQLSALQAQVPPSITQLYAQNGLLDGFLGGRNA